jgi:hypothetical protein
MQNRSRILLIVATAALFIGTAVLFVRAIRPRIVGRTVAPDGTEMCIVQKFNWSPELFTTKFFFRKPGSNWGTFYYDHQDDYWGTSPAKIAPNSTVAVFYRGNTPAVTFDWSTETYTLHRRNDTSVGAQSKMPPGWNPAIDE